MNIIELQNDKDYAKVILVSHIRSIEFYEHDNSMSIYATTRRYRIKIVFEEAWSIQNDHILYFESEKEQKKKYKELVDIWKGDCISCGKLFEDKQEEIKEMWSPLGSEVAEYALELRDKLNEVIRATNKLIETSK